MGQNSHFDQHGDVFGGGPAAERLHGPQHTQRIVRLRPEVGVEVLQRKVLQGAAQSSQSVSWFSWMCGPPVPPLCSKQHQQPQADVLN